MTKTTTRLLGTLVAMIGLVGLVAAVPASAAKLSGKTILAPNSETLDALSSLGVTVEPADDTKVGGNGVIFPVTSGKFDPETGAAKINHDGGLVFVGMGTELAVEDFTVKVGEKNVIKAVVPGAGKLRLADLNTKKVKIKEKGDQVVISNIKATLAKKAAKALSETFDIGNLTGAEIGITKTKLDTK